MACIEATVLPLEEDIPPDWTEIATVDRFAKDRNGPGGDLGEPLATFATIRNFRCRWRFSESIATLGLQLGRERDRLAATHDQDWSIQA